MPLSKDIYSINRREKSVCFTGHRPQTIRKIQIDDLRLDLSQAIQDAILNGYEDFYCGMAMGSDIIAGELVASLREQYPWIRLLCTIPFPQQSSGWPSQWQKRYQALLRRADETTILYPGYFRGGYLARDRYMVDHSSLLIGVYNGSYRGGTAYTVRYAQKQGLKIQILQPGQYQR